MILLCLGPVRGTLELQPYDEEAEAYEVPTIPGLIGFTDVSDVRKYAASVFPSKNGMMIIN